MTWGAVPADQATKSDDSSQSQQNQNNNNYSNGGNGYYTNPWDIFNYYFGNQN